VRSTGLCPTFERPSQQRDGLLFRIPLVGGALTVEQLELIADLAERHGSGVVELTGRGNLQLRGVADAAVGTVVDALAAAGLGDELARVVTISPLAGPRERSVRTVVIDALATIDLTGLSGKFVVHVDDGSRGSVRHADIVVTPGPGTGRATVELGAQRSVLPVTEATGVVLDIVRACIAHGPDARRKDVTDEPGVGSTDPSSASGFVPPLGHLATPDGAVFVAGVPLGRTSPEQLRAVARTCRRFDARSVSVTPWRSLVFAPGVPSAPALADELDRIELITSATHPAHGVVACIGRDGCWQTELDTLGEAALVVARRSSGDLVASTVHVSGCAKSCAGRGPVALTLLGRDDSSGFDLVPGR
jgi:precorrin-3B synthase